MTTYKVSVIMTVYNTQDTIRRAIDSVINQTLGFSNIELIIYDDNSTDNTRNILKEYAEKYDNIILIFSNENSGHCGKGRNEGIEMVSADYIMFLDGDDKYLPDICETLYNEIINEKADLISSNFINIDKNSSKVEYNRYRNGISKGNKIYFLNEEVYDFTDGYVTSKIFKKSIIIENNVRFPEDKIIEDSFFICLLLNYVNKIVYLKDYIGFLRYVQENSLHKKEDFCEAEGIFDMCLVLYSVYKKNNKNIDFSWISSIFIGTALFYFYKSNILNNKKDSYNFLDRIYIYI